MRQETYTDSVLVESREVVGSERIIRDGRGVEIRRELLSQLELDEIVDEGKPSPDETLVIDIGAATTIADLKAALIRRFSG